MIFQACLPLQVRYLFVMLARRQTLIVIAAKPYVKHMGKYQRNICPQKIIIAHILIMKITVGTS